jgi:hypothetical protein
MGDTDLDQKYTDGKKNAPCTVIKTGKVLANAEYRK